jgi:hypothetical protein
MDEFTVGQAQRMSDSWGLPGRRTSSVDRRDQV